MGIEENQENQKDQEYLHPFRLAPKFMPATRRNCNNMAIYSEQQLLQASIISRIFFSQSQLQSPGCGSKSVLFYSFWLQIPGRELQGPRRAPAAVAA